MEAEQLSRLALIVEAFADLDDVRKLRILIEMAKREPGGRSGTTYAEAINFFGGRDSGRRHIANLVRKKLLVRSATMNGPVLRLGSRARTILRNDPHIFPD